MIKGLFIIMSEHKQYEMAAVAAVQLLSKMLDFQKNPCADLIAKELVKANADFLAMFGIEHLLKVEGGRKSMLNVLKIFVERKESLYKSEEIVKGLLKTGETQKELIEHILFQKRVARDSSHERNSSISRSSLRLGKSTDTRRPRNTMKKRSEIQVDSYSSMSDFLKTAHRNKTTNEITTVSDHQPESYSSGLKPSQRKP